jgi:PAS domain S-box-containing protein
MNLSGTSARHPAAINASVIAIAYAALGALWVLISDRVVHGIYGHRPELLSEAQTVKGLAFIAVTAVVLYLTARALTRSHGEPDATSEQRFSALVESLPDYAVAILSPDGRIAIWSAGAEQLTGFSAAEAKGQPLARVFEPVESARSNLERMLADAGSHGSVAMQGWHLRKDGSRYRARSVTTALRRGDGTGIGFVHVMRDMTERQRPAGAPRETRAADRLRGPGAGHDEQRGPAHGP